MAERAHPNDSGFQAKWKFCLRKGFIPWLTYKSNPYRAAFYWRYQWVGNFCRDRDVLDVPSGVGWGTSLIKGAKSITGVDISPEAIAEAVERYGNGRQFVTGSMEQLDFPDASFDVVSCLEGIEHVPKTVGKSFMAEAKRVLRKGGLLLLSSPHPIHGAHSGNPWHIYEYPPPEMRELIELYFKIEKETQRKVENLIITYIKARKTD